MFSQCLQSVEKYTHPVIYTMLRFDGRLESGCGTFVVINKDGWIITAAHIVREMERITRDSAELAEYHRLKAEVENNKNLDHKKKEKAISHLPHKNAWIQKQAIMWGFPPCGTLTKVVADDFVDLAIGQLSPFDPNWVIGYPTFKNPNEPMLPGTSLCRLGFPFHEIKATYDPATGEFGLQPGVLPVPRFPNDGIHTRIILNPSPDGSRTSKLIETSTPGLRGQSGGPIFDTNGHIWAIQNLTQSLDLGFATSEKQYLHVGWGAHSEEVIRLLKVHGVDHVISS